MKRNAKLFILVTVILIVIISVVFLVFVQVMHKVGPVKIINVDIQPENPTAYDEITLTVTTENASSCHIMSTYCGSGYMSPYSSGYMSPIGNNKFQRNFGLAFTNGTMEKELYPPPPFTNQTIWFVVLVSATGNNKDIYAVEKCIKIGEIKINNTTNLAINNISNIPEIPDTSTISVTFYADVKSNVNISNVELIYAVAFPNGGGFDSSEMNTSPHGNENRYSTSISLSSSSAKIQKSTKIFYFYFIIAKDESGSTVITSTYSFIIS